jgi:antirestriction protein ArdC
LTAPPATQEFSPVLEAEQVLAKTGATIRHGFDCAFYVPSRDEICLPNRERFTSEVNYYATALHELAHWTGIESRLNRTFGRCFGDDAYAMEELVAELSAAFSMGSLGLVNGTIENHASYVDGWLKCLKADKSAIFTAASQAAKASDFILTSQANA